MTPLPPPYGGGEIMSEILVEGLKKSKQFNIYHLNTSDNRGNSNRGKFDILNIYNGLLNLYRMVRLIRRLKPEVVYLPISKTYRSFMRDALYINTASSLGVKVVAHLHGGYFTLNDGHGIRKRIVNYSLQNIHTLLVLGKNMKEKFESKLPVKNIRVVYNGIRPLG